MTLNFCEAKRPEAVRIALAIVTLLRQNISDCNHRDIDRQDNFSPAHIVQPMKHRGLYDLILKMLHCLMLGLTPFKGNTLSSQVHEQPGNCGNIPDKDAKHTTHTEKSTDMHDRCAFWPILDLLNFSFTRNPSFKGALVTNNDHIQGSKHELLGGVKKIDVWVYRKCC
jgi:hypothetical protein